MSAALLPRLLAAVALALALPAHAQEPPDALVQRLAQETTALIRADAKLAAGDPARVREVIEARLLPHFDFGRMTQLAMGRHWARATPEQQQRLTGAFRTLLVRTYSKALTDVRDGTIRLRPFRAEPGAAEVTVRTEVVRAGRPPVQIDYGMARTPDGWKAYDVVVGGVSLVTNYRDDFNEAIRTGGVDGLQRSLDERNRTGGA